MAGNIRNRLGRLESATRNDKARLCGVRFVSTPEESHTPAPDSKDVNYMWGSGSDTWRIFIKPGQSNDDAYREAGIDPDKDKVLCWGTA